MSYRFERFDVALGCGTVLNAVNDSSVAVGAFEDESGAVHGFRSMDEKITVLDAPGAESTFTQGVDRLNRVYGDFRSETGSYRGFRMEDGEYTLIDAPGAQHTFIADAGPLGQYAGTLDDSDGRHGFYVDEKDRFHRLDFPGAHVTLAYGINRHNHVVGSYIGDASLPRPFVFRDGDFETLPLPDDAVCGLAKAVDEHAYIVGQYFLEEPSSEEVYNPDKPRGFVLRDGVTVPLEFPDSVLTGPVGVSSGGVIAGFYDDPNGTRHGFLAFPRDIEK